MIEAPAERRARLRLEGLRASMVFRYPNLKFERVTHSDLACDWIRLQIGSRSLPILASQISDNGIIESQVLDHAREMLSSGAT